MLGEIIKGGRFTLNYYRWQFIVAMTLLCSFIFIIFRVESTAASTLRYITVLMNMLDASQTW